MLTQNRPCMRMCSLRYLLIFHLKHMVWVLKQTVFWALETNAKNDGLENIYKMLKIYGLCSKCVFICTNENIHMDYSYLAQLVS